MVRKRILLIIPEISMGGAQRSISKLSVELSRNHQVWLVIFNKKNDMAYPYGGELLSLDVVPRDNTLHKLKSFVQRITRLRKLKKQLGIDVSISFLEGADYVNIISKSRDKIVLSIRGSKRYDEMIIGGFFWLRNKILIPWLYRRADMIVTVNHGIAKELRTHYGLEKSRMVTIGNFYDVNEITRLSLEPKSKNMNRLYQDPILITTGRLAPEKGLKQLVRIFYGLKKKSKNLRLVMVGEGPMHNELVLLCSELDLLHAGPDFDDLPDVVFMGNQSNVFKYLKSATMYLLNSSSEGFPNGLAEAMICSVPVVSSDCPYGPREILAPEFPFILSVSKPYFSPHGILMPLINSDEDIKIWIETLEEILGKSNILSQFAEKGLERINLFDQQFIVSQWLRVVED